MNGSDRTRLVRIYLAGPLFTEAEQRWHRTTRDRLVEAAKTAGVSVEVIWPYELVPQSPNLTADIIAVACRTALLKADLLLALLDGPQIDDGTSWEIGAYDTNRHWLQENRLAVYRPIFGIRTDFRKAGDTRNGRVNAMIEWSCDAIVATTDELIEKAVAFAKERLATLAAAEAKR